MPPLGAHMSIAGGYHRAVDRAAQYGCDCLQLFTKNNLQWNGRPISRPEADRFRQALARRKIGHPLAHASYLINLASADRPLWRRSRDGLAEEITRAARLGVGMVVIHPGAYGRSTITAGIRRIARALDQVYGRCGHLPVRCLLETTAGQGTSVGWQFEQLADILAQVRHQQWLAVCFDTCHVFAAGYRLAPEEEYQATIQALDETIGLNRVLAFHLNDSRGELGCRIDRHAHIGRGHIGPQAFRLLLRDERFSHRPMYLETPKETLAGRDMDRVNLALLRRLSRPEEP